MRVIEYRQYGPPEVLRLTEAEKPVPQANELLIKVHATSVTAGDAILRSGKFPPLFWLPGRLMFGLFRPRKHVLGHEYAGEVEAVGSAVTRFKPGDRVFGTTTDLPSGAYAEHLCAPEDGVIEHMPANTDFAGAAAGVVGWLTALHFLRAAKIAEEKRVLIVGASGSVGTSAVQLAKHFGAKVVGVCSGANADLVHSLGADRVIDHTREDFTRCGEIFDIVFDTVGKTTPAKSNRVVAHGGFFVTTSMTGKVIFQSVFGRVKVIMGIASEKGDGLRVIRDLLESEAIRPVIESRHPLEEIVEVHRHVDGGHKKGNVVITMTD